MTREATAITEQRRALGARLAAFHQATGLTQAQLATARHKVDAILASPLVSLSSLTSGEDDEIAALELVRRVSASDVGDETLTQLEVIVDQLAMAYPVTPPDILLLRLRSNLSQVSVLMDKRMTLTEKRRLMVISAWLSLLAATVHIDLDHTHAAIARLRTAASLAKHAEHDEIRAWCYETEAWRVLTEGDFRKAVQLSRTARALAPTGSSIAIQSAAQEGRTWARLKEPRETYNAIERVSKLVSPMKRPEQPEHHYRYDPDKSVAYLATTLAWVGDPAAESFAREIIDRLKPSEATGKWPRRASSANLDLALILLNSDRLDEACDAAQRAIVSGHVVPSNYWRAAEVVSTAEARQLPESTDLREAFENLRRKGNQTV